MVAYGPNVGSMLASNADRDRATDVLRAGFAEGRLTQAEFEERLARVQRSRTYDQLAELTGDLPAGPWAGAVVPYRERAARAVEPSFANLALTAVVVFTLAAIVTALAFYAHLHGSAFTDGQSPTSPTYLEPYVLPLQQHMQPLQHIRP